MRCVAFFGLCAALPASSVADNNDGRKPAVEAFLSDNLNDIPFITSDISYARSLQEGVEGIFRATWGTDHTGSCALASPPAATMTCANGAEIALVDQTEGSTCSVTGTSEITCVGNLGTMFYSAEFSCAAVEGDFPGAQAVLGEEEEDCLGGTPESGTWVHGIQIFLMCDGDPEPVGVCEPDESVGMNNACSLGFTCSQGGCTAETLTIPDISSTIEEADCSITPSPTASLAPSVVPTVTESQEPTVSPAPSEVPTVTETASPTITAAPSVSPAPTGVDTTMPTVVAEPTSVTPPSETPPAPAGGSTPQPAAAPTSASSLCKAVTIASLLSAGALALVGSF